MDPLRTTRAKVLNSSVLVALSIGAIGAMSVEIFAVGARYVNPDDLSRFITTWVALNTSIIALGASFDQLGPRLISRFDGLDASLIIRATLLPGVGSLMVYLLMRSLHIEVVGLVPTLAYISTTSLWTGERSLRLAYGEFRQLLIGAAGVFASCTIALCCVVVFSNLTAAGLLWTGACSNLVGYLVLVRQPTEAVRSGIRSPLPRSEISLAVAISLASGAGLALSSGAIVLATSWGLSSSEAVAFAGMVNIARIPFMLLNSVSAPMNVEIAQSVANGDQTRALRLTMKWAASVSIASCAICIAVVIFGSFLLKVFITGDYEFSLRLAVAAVGVEAFVLIAGAPRVLGIVLGRPMVVGGQWLAGVLIFFAVGVIESLGSSRLILAPIAGSMTVVILSMGWAISEMSGRNSP